MKRNKVSCQQSEKHIRSRLFNNIYEVNAQINLDLDGRLLSHNS